MRLISSFLLTTLAIATDGVAGIKINLCCPSGEISSEAGCTNYQGNIPPFIAQWTSGEESEVELKSSGSRFQCQSETAGQVRIELLFGPIEARINERTGSLKIGNETEEIASYSNGDFCVVYSNQFSEDGQLYSSYVVCYEAETSQEKDQRFLTGILYPSAILISAIFILITIIFYLTVGGLRKTLFAKITLGFLINVFICYLLLAITYNFLFSGQDFLGSVACKVLGYIIHHTFIAFFFWMSAMAFNIAKSLSTMKIVRNSKSSFKSFLVYFLFAQGIPMLFTIFIVLMDAIKPKDALLPNVGEFSCFVGSEYVLGKSFFRTSEFLYYYLVVLAIIIFNVVCFLVTAFNLSRHWQAMKDIQTTR